MACISVSSVNNDALQLVEKVVLINQLLFVVLEVVVGHVEREGEFNFVAQLDFGVGLEVVLEPLENEYLDIWELLKGNSLFGGLLFGALIAVELVDSSESVPVDIGIQRLGNVSNVLDEKSG